MIQKTMKTLRNEHRKANTHHVTTEVKEDVFVRERRKNTGYVPLRKWIRSLTNISLTGKALQLALGGK